MGRSEIEVEYYHQGILRFRVLMEVPEKGETSSGWTVWSADRKGPPEHEIRIERVK